MKVTKRNVDLYIKQEYEHDVLAMPLSLAFAGTYDTKEAVAIVSLAFGASVQAHTETSPGKEYPLTLTQYLLTMLDREDKVRKPGFFKDENEAGTEGFYWFAECKKWIRLDSRH